MNYTSYLRWGTLTGIFIVPFVPFVISTSMFFPFITGKTFVFRIIVEIILALYLLLALREPSYRPRASYIMYALGAFLLFAGLATVFSVDPSKSFWSNFERMEGYLGLLHLAAYFIVTSVVLNTQRLWNTLFHVSVAAAVIMGIYGALQLMGAITINQGGVRLDGTFGNATYLAVYMLIHFFLTALLCLRWRGTRWMHLLYGAAMIIELVMLYYTATRGAILGTIGGVILAALAIAIFGREHRTLRRFAMGALAATVLLVGGFMALKNSEFARQSPVLSRFSTMSLSEGTVQARFLVWSMALQGFAEKPILGWGQENFNFVFNKYYDPAMYSQEQWFDRAHNSFLDWLIAGGVPTFLAYVSLFILAFLAFWRSSLPVAERAILVGLVAAYAFHLLFVFDNLISSVYFMTLLAYAHHLKRRELPNRLELMRPLRGGSWAGAAVAIILILGAAGYYFNVPAIARAQTLLQAIIPQKEQNGQVVAKDPAENLAQFREAYGIGVPMGRQEVVEQAISYASNVSNSQNVNPQTKQDFAAFAYEAGSGIVAERPGDARLELFLGSFLNISRRYDEAALHLTKALEYSPRKQGILFELGVNTYLNAGKDAEGIETLKKAFELEKRNNEARVLYAIALLYAGRTAEADAIIEEGYGSVIVDESRLLKTYFDMKLYDRVVAIWQKRVAAQPSDLQLRVSLAAAYLAAGDRERAITTLQEAIALDPRFKQDGERFINEIRAGRNP